VNLKGVRRIPEILIIIFGELIALIELFWSFKGR